MQNDVLETRSKQSSFIYGLYQLAEVWLAYGVPSFLSALILISLIIPYQTSPHPSPIYPHTQTHKRQLDSLQNFFFPDDQPFSAVGRTVEHGKSLVYSFSASKMGRFEWADNMSTPFVCSRPGPPRGGAGKEGAPPFPRLPMRNSI